MTLSWIAREIVSFYTEIDRMTDGLTEIPLLDFLAIRRRSDDNFLEPVYAIGLWV